MDKAKAQQAQTLAKQSMEALKDIGSSTVKNLKEEVTKNIPEEFFDQILGGYSKRSFSGEINPGEAIEIKDVFTGQIEEKRKVRQQVMFERKMVEEEEILIRRRSNELRIELKRIMEEVVSLTQNTQELAKETQIAAMQAPVEPGVYHIVFFEKLLQFLQSFKKKIEEATVWLSAVNSRAEKKNYWARYKKHGSKFFLSGEHYLSRSAG